MMENISFMKDSSRMTVRQLVILVEFMEKHPELASGRIDSKFRPADRTRLWQELAEQLNGSNRGAVKSVKKWEKSWNDWKSNLKKKMHKGSPKTGRGSHKTDLTELEQRGFAILVHCASLKNMQIMPKEIVSTDFIVVAPQALASSDFIVVTPQAFTPSVRYPEETVKTESAEMDQDQFYGQTQPYVVHVSKGDTSDVDEGDLAGEMEIVYNDSSTQLETDQPSSDVIVISSQESTCSVGEEVSNAESTDTVENNFVKLSEAVPNAESANDPVPKKDHFTPSAKNRKSKVKSIRPSIYDAVKHFSEYQLRQTEVTKAQTAALNSFTEVLQNSMKQFSDVMRTINQQLGNVAAEMKRFNDNIDHDD